MLRIAFTAADLARTRFAFSPLWEVMASIRVLHDPGAHSLHRPWVEQVRRRLDPTDPDWRLLAGLVPPAPHSMLDFLSPPPNTPVPDLDLELTSLRATPADEVTAALATLPGPAPPVDGLLDRLAGAVRAYWTAAIAPYWPRVLTLLEGDVLYRARRLAEGGAHRLFDDLDPHLTWDTDTLYVTRRRQSGTLSLDGRGLLLVPSAFAWPRLYSKTAPPWQPTLRYPPRGVATLWEHREADPPAALAAVLGRSRALLLAELDTPASTTDLARRTGMDTGGVSRHLTALRDARLVSAHRTGRYVLYARTRIAETLLADG
ncbi:MAG: DUF5937 family protein [Mycobacteriales bacterium]